MRCSKAGRSPSTFSAPSRRRSRGTSRATCIQEHVHWVRGEVAPGSRARSQPSSAVPWRAYDGGDHSLFVGEVVRADYRDGDGLGYIYSRFSRLEEPVFGMEYIFG